MAKNTSDVYSSLGVTPIIHAGGTTTKFGGTKLRSEAMQAMSKASTIMVDVDELNRQAGKVIADLTGAEAGFVSSGAGGGLVLQAAACIAGTDPSKMAQLPNTEGLKNEILIQTCHRFGYDQCYRAAGAKLINVGDGRKCEPWQLESAISERTAAIAYLVSGFLARRALPLEQVCEIAHAHEIPVIVDAASMLPPRANLRKFIGKGADMVIYSGGKGVRGPQGTGILCGRADLIEAAAANASPNPFIGRGMKVAKEEIAGLVTALQIFVDEDEQEENKRYQQMGESVIDALVEIPNLKISVEYDNYDYNVPMAIVTFTEEWDGPNQDQILMRLLEGNPPIYLSTQGGPNQIGVEPTNLTDEELHIVIQRLREVLLNRTGNAY